MNINIPYGVSKVINFNTLVEVVYFRFKTLLLKYEQSYLQVNPISPVSIKLSNLACTDIGNLFLASYIVNAS